MVSVIVRQSGQEKEGEVYVGNNHIPIQKALDYVNSKGGGKVFIEKGTYEINNTSNMGQDNYGYRGIRVYSNTDLQGEGEFTILKGTYSNTSGHPSNIACLEVSNVHIHGLKIIGGYCGIVVYKSQSIEIKNCIMDNVEIGIYLTSSSVSTVTGNNVSNNKNHGICLGDSSDNNTITGNTLSSNKGIGIHLSNSANSNTVTGNVVSNNIGNGIYLYISSNNNTIVGNIISNNHSSGIQLYTSSNNTITGNTISNNKGNGIYLYTSSNNNTITGNVVNNNKSDGIHLISSSNNTITGNTLNNVEVDGVYLTSSSKGNAIIGNTTSKCGNFDIYLNSDSSNTIVEGNTCDNAKNGIYVLNSPDSILAGNLSRTSGSTSSIIDKFNYNPK